MYKNEKVNVVMAVYNEEKTVAEIIRRILAQKEVDRLIIVNDASTDKSLSIISNAAKKNKRITYFTNKKNGGKGFSVRRAIDEVKDGIIIVQDADLEYYPEDYPKFYPKIKDDTFVLGTRTRQSSDKSYFLAKSANTVFTTTFNILYGRNFKDINTCYKVFKKSMLKGIKLKQNDFLFDMEVLVDLVKKGYKSEEVDIRYKGRTYAEGKKIKSEDAIKQGLFIISERFSE